MIVGGGRRVVRRWFVVEGRLGPGSSCCGSDPKMQPLWVCEVDPSDERYTLGLFRSHCWTERPAEYRGVVNFDSKFGVKECDRVWTWMGELVRKS